MDKLKLIKDVAIKIVILSYAISLIINSLANYIVAKNSKKPPKSAKTGGLKNKK